MSQQKAPPEHPSDGPAKTEKPTLKTIARISGLAVPTVSRALNDAPDIGSETKKLIRRIATEIGYVPNRAGVRLRTGRTNVISLVMSTEHDLMTHNARLIASVASGLRNTPFHMIMTPFFPDQDRMDPVRYIVETGSADAVILNQIQPQDPRVAYLMDRKFPFATHGRTDWADQHPYYDFDNRAFAYLATDELIGRGRKHILVIAPPQAQNYALHMIDGAQNAAKAGRIGCTIAKGITSDSVSGEIVDFMIDILGRQSDIDAVLCASTSSAMAAVAGIEKFGATVGQEVDVYAKEAVPFLKLFRADILTMSEQVNTAGEFLAKAAMQAVRHPDLAPMQELEVPTSAGG
ncbi:LacI family transcriptional regulator [Yoonia sp. 2307UL14-13]|uniref:LacI family transcriptional regulator n=1 Tax=Yoonia sp. 2307UL14-13 TaxID=3126506 RepID=UPI0030AD87A2